MDRFTLRELRVGLDPGSGVVEIDVAAGVELRELGTAQLVEDAGSAAAVIS